MATTAVVTEAAAPVAAVAPKKTTPATTSKRKPAAKAAKKAAPAPKSKAKPEAAEDTRTITPLIKATTNPCKPGSFCFAQVHAALTSKTVAEAAKKLATDARNPTRSRKIEIGWMVRKRYIKIGD